jgi:hypothetical protein
MIELMSYSSQVSIMSTKEFAVEIIKGLPEDTTWKEIEISIHLLAEVNMGYEELRRGQGTTVANEAEFLNLARATR